MRYNTDLSKIKDILLRAKQTIKTVESGNYEKGNLDESLLSVDSSTLVESNDMYSQPTTQSISPTNMGVNHSYTNEQVKNSGLPDSVKAAMINNKIPHMSQNTGLEGLEELIESPKQKKTNINESKRDVGFNKSELREMVKDVLIEYLTTDYNKTITENVVKRTITTLIKEGKIRVKK